MAKTRRTYTPEFKAEAVKLVTEQGYSSPRPPAPSASARTRSATGSRPSKPRATRPSPATATFPPSRRSSAASGPRTSGS